MVCENLYLRKIEDKWHWDPVLQKYTNIFPLPCGKCTACKIQIAKEWALRCCLELPYWDKSIFTTLTFNDENNVDPSIHKAEFQEFIQNLRNDMRASKQKIKILGCGEYGDKSMRKHYHAIIFGIGLSNEQRQIGKDKTYLSENGIIEKNWLKGNVFNGVVTYNSARYVASYVFKKYYDNTKWETYSKYGLENPFQYTSGGIGKRFYQDYKNQIINNGYIMLNGVKNSIPRYFLKLYEKNGYDVKLKKQQKKHAAENFDKWYKNYIENLAGQIGCQPDKLNDIIIKDRMHCVEKYEAENKRANRAKAALAEARNQTY